MITSRIKNNGPEERASIEAQCAFKIIAGLRAADKLTDLHPLYRNLLAWLELRTAAALANRPAPGLPPGRHFTNVGQLLTAANRELKLTRNDVLCKLKISGVSQIADPDGAWMVLTGKKQVR